MIDISIGIVFGGQSPEHNESIRATRALYKHAIRGRLDRKYTFRYFYLSSKNKWASNEDSKDVIRKTTKDSLHFSNKRLLELSKMDVIYNTMMGPCGENGNIMGLADLLNVPMIGCGITASALTSDKKLSKLVAESIDVPVVESLCVNRKERIGKIVNAVEKTVGYPCFVKPTNLGTCSHVFHAEDQIEFIQKWTEVSYMNDQSEVYLVEKFTPNLEIRVFVFEDQKGKLHFNDKYVTTLKEHALDVGGGLFDHHENKLPQEIRDTIQKYTERIFHAFGMKDYARVDFFVTPNMQIYFNEANTQPFIGKYNMYLLHEDGYPITKWMDMMITKYLI